MTQPVGIPPSADDQTQERPIALLRRTLSMLCNFVWTRQLRSGEHMWTIPADSERDFDCIISDAIDELEQKRAELTRLRADVAELMRQREKLLDGIGRWETAEVHYTALLIDLRALVEQWKQHIQLIGRKIDAQPQTEYAMRLDMKAATIELCADELAARLAREPNQDPPQ